MGKFWFFELFEKGGDFLVEAYNYYLGGYLPKVPAKSSLHKKSELKSIYKNIRSLNQKSPLGLIQLSDNKQAYILDVKEMSMELNAATEETLAAEAMGGDKKKSFEKTLGIFNRLLKRSDEFARESGNPSRPGGELRNLIQEFAYELDYAGVTIREDSTLYFEDDGEDEIRLPDEFLASLCYKSRSMSMNPFEYIDKKIYNYSFLSGAHRPSAYYESAYSGMLFNSYC